MRPTWSPYFHIKFHPWSYLPALSHCTLMLSHFSHVQLFATPLTAACQIPLSIGFSRQEYWNRLPCPPSGDLPHSRMEPTSFMFPASAGGFFSTSSTFGLQSLLKFLSSRRTSQEIMSLPYKIWQVLWQSSSVLIPREFTIATVCYSGPRSGTVGGVLAGWRDWKINDINLWLHRELIKHYHTYHIPWLLMTPFGGKHWCTFYTTTSILATGNWRIGGLKISVWVKMKSDSPHLKDWR